MLNLAIIVVRRTAALITINKKKEVMKRIRIRSLGLLAALTFIAGINAHAADPGSITIKITATSQALSGLATYSTNSSSTVTNLTATSKYTTSNSIIDDTRLLQMLANSFNETYPPGSALKLSSSGDIVVANGTNIVRDAVSVLSLTQSNNPITSGTITSKEKIAPGGTTGSSTFAMIQSAAAGLSYDDSGLSTADGSTTRFHIPGVEDNHIIMSSSGTENFSLMLDFAGGGSGSISNSVSSTDFVLRATAVGAMSVKGVVP